MEAAGLDPHFPLAGFRKRVSRTRPTSRSPALGQRQTVRPLLLQVGEDWPPRSRLSTCNVLPPIGIPGFGLTFCHFSRSWSPKLPRSARATVAPDCVTGRSTMPRNSETPSARGRTDFNVIHTRVPASSLITGGAGIACECPALPAGAPGPADHRGAADRASSGFGRHRWVARMKLLKQVMQGPARGCGFHGARRRARMEK